MEVIMTDNKPVRPEDLLPTGVDSGVINGVEVRKGTVAAFVANAKRLEALPSDSDEYTELAHQLRAARPLLEAIGVLEVFDVRSQRLREIFAVA
jgi:hypothetical protein